jgi:hypothetical protein
VVGNGSFGSGGDGGPATAAQIGFVHSIAVDSAGNLYIADRNSNKIRKVDTSGMISTIAGNGAFCGNTPCPTGDGGPAILAQLNSPEGVAVDPGGNLYIADGFNNRIRKIAAGANGTVEGTDTITTVAGTGDKAYGGDEGPAIAAQLNFPQDVAIDSGGNVYAGDFANRRVRRIESVAVPSPIQLTGAASRKTHGSAGTFEINLPLTGNRGIECRSGGPNGDHTIVFSFTNALTSVEAASTSCGSVSSSMIDSGNAHRYLVNITGCFANAQSITSTLIGVHDDHGNILPMASASIGLLLGDVTGNAVVTNTDVASVKAQVAAPVAWANFRSDVNANGIISNTDVSATKGQVGTQLP